MMVVGGIDAGGTATKCLLLEPNGRILAELKGEPANYQAGAEAAASAIKAILAEAIASSGVNRIDVLGIGMAGAGRKPELAQMKKCLGNLDGVGEYYLTNDGEIAVLGAHCGRPGMVLIAGTGSIAYGLRQDGVMVRRGGWGAILGDEGSGYWIGLQAVKALIRAAEGRERKTELSITVLEGLGLNSLEMLPSLVYSRSLGRKEIASLVPIVIKTAEQGDAIAEEIINAAVSELIMLVNAVQQVLDFKASEVAVSGGLFSNPWLTALFSQRLEESCGSVLVEPSYPAVFGAAIYGARQTGLKLSFA